MSIQFILFIIINDIKYFNRVKLKLKEIGVAGYTVIDTMGSTNLYNCGTRYSNYVSGVMNENRMYNKTIFLALPSEEEAVRIMDEVEEIIYYDYNKPGKGVMFTIPVYKSHGIV
ncbi:MAG: P-II family nitrogen regulator [Eubacteriales bacterium]